MFVQQIIILSHKTYKLAHESQTRQNDYPNFVQILAAGVFNYYQGVEHVTFFANEKYGYWKTVLHHFIAKGFLDVVDMEFVNHKDFYEQQVALQSCNRHYRYASRFVIYNDVDEFFIPIDSNNTIRSLVHRYDSIIPNALAFKV